MFFKILLLFQTPHCTIPLSYSILPSSWHFLLYCKFYFPPCYALFLFLTLTISPLSIISKAYFFPLVSSHSLPLLIIFVFPFHLYKLWLIPGGYYGYCSSPSTAFLLFTIFYFKSHTLLSSCITSFCLSLVLDCLKLEFYFFPFLSLDSSPHSYYFSTPYPIKIFFSFFKNFIYF